MVPNFGFAIKQPNKSVWSSPPNHLKFEGSGDSNSNTEKNNSESITTNINKSYYVETFEPKEDHKEEIPKTPSPEHKICRKSLEDSKCKKRKFEAKNDADAGGSKKGSFESPYLFNMTFGGALNKLKDGENYKSSFISSPSIMLNNENIDYSLITRPKQPSVKSNLHYSS